MRLLSKSQLVGTSPGCAVFRDLFEDDEGNRISVSVSKEFWIDKADRKLTRQELLINHRLEESK